MIKIHGQLKAQNTLIEQSENIDNSHQSENLLKQMSRYRQWKPPRELGGRQHARLL